MFTACLCRCFATREPALTWMLIGHILQYTLYWLGATLILRCNAMRQGTAWWIRGVLKNRVLNLTESWQLPQSSVPRNEEHILETLLNIYCYCVQIARKISLSSIGTGVPLGFRALGNLPAKTNLSDTVILFHSQVSPLYYVHMDHQATASSSLKRPVQFVPYQVSIHHTLFTRSQNYGRSGPKLYSYVMTVGAAKSVKLMNGLCKHSTCKILACFLINVTWTERVIMNSKSALLPWNSSLQWRIHLNCL